MRKERLAVVRLTVRVILEFYIVLFCSVVIIINKHADMKLSANQWTI